MFFLVDFYIFVCREVYYFVFLHVLLMAWAINVN